MASASPRTPARRRTTATPICNNGGTLPSFQLVGNQDLLTNPANGFFKSHWAFGDTTEAENWAVRGDVQFDPPFIESGGVTFSGGLRLANREVDYEFGRYPRRLLRQRRAGWLGFRRRTGRRSAISRTAPSATSPASSRRRRGEFPVRALRSIRQLAGADHALPDLHRHSGSGRDHQRFLGPRPHHRQCRAGEQPLADGATRRRGSRRCIRIRRSRSSPRRWKRSRSKRRRRRPT